MGFGSYVSNVLDRLFIYFCVLTLNLGAFTLGITFAWSSPALPKLDGTEDPQNNPLTTPITPTQASWIASLSLVGALLGTLLPTILVPYIRRKNALLVLCTSYVVGYAMKSFSANVEVLFVARFICGIGVGATFSIIPVYVGEIAETANRGALGCCFGIFVTLGNLFAYVIGPFVSFRTFNLLCMIPPIWLITFGYICVPESPYDLVANNVLSKAEEALRKLRHGKSLGEIRNEMHEMSLVIDDCVRNQVTPKDFLYCKPLRKAILILISLALFQQLSAINAVIFYMQHIFDVTGSTIVPYKATIYVGIAQVVATLSTPLIVDRFGRKILLLASSMFLTLSLFGLGLFFYLQSTGINIKTFFWIPIISLFIYMFFFNIGFGSIPYVLMGEIFPSNAKNIASTITIFCLTLSGFIVTLVFPILIESITIGKTFMMASGFCFVAFAFVFWYVPETKGKSFLVIQEIMKK